MNIIDERRFIPKLIDLVSNETDADTVFNLKKYVTSPKKFRQQVSKDLIDSIVNVNYHNFDYDAVYDLKTWIYLHDYQKNSKVIGSWKPGVGISDINFSDIISFKLITEKADEKSIQVSFHSKVNTFDSKLDEYYQKRTISYRLIISPDHINDIEQTCLSTPSRDGSKSKAGWVDLIIFRSKNPTNIDHKQTKASVLFFGTNMFHKKAEIDSERFFKALYSFCLKNLPKQIIKKIHFKNARTPASTEVQRMVQPSGQIRMDYDLFFNIEASVNSKNKTHYSRYLSIRDIQ